MRDEQNPNYYLCYATANDKRFYLQDIKNLVNICNCNSGVDKLYLYISISKIREIDWFDKIFVNTVILLFNDCATIDLVEISFKENIGRDFSSYSLMSKKILQVAKSNDYVFFRNRSACGPFLTNWYLLYIDQFMLHEKVAIIGSTINFNDHPERSFNTNLPHVQTYAFLTKVKYLEMLRESFPGEKETTRLNIILNGEIGLSQFFLKNGFYIKCLEWPGKLIEEKSQPLASSDCKEGVIEDHPFYHRRFMRRNKTKMVPDSLMKPLIIYFSYFLRLCHRSVSRNEQRDVLK